MILKNQLHIHSFHAFTTLLHQSVTTNEVHVFLFTEEQQSPFVSPQHASRDYLACVGGRCLQFKQHFWTNVLHVTIVSTQKVCKNHTKHTNTLCGPNTKYLKGTANGALFHFVGHMSQNRNKSCTATQVTPCLQFRFFLLRPGCSWGSRLCPTVMQCTVSPLMTGKYRAQVVADKPAPVTIYPPQIPHWPHCVQCDQLSKPQDSSKKLQILHTNNYLSTDLHQIWLARSVHILEVL